ncbi:MAG: alpha/beta fold hydrolase [Pseudomonadales bacterium]
MTELHHKTILTNGVNMHYVEAGSGPLVVLCHGFPESWYSWRHQLTALANAGYRVVAPDQRGYGQTDKPEAIEAYSQQHLVGDIVGLVQGLGETNAVVVGHDWGAPVAWNAALWRPDIFRAVAALSVPISDRAPVSPLTSLRAMFGDRFFYMLYFQTPGVAEHELQHDVQTSMRRFLFAASGNAPDNGMEMMQTPPANSAYFLEQMPDTETLPPWLTQADLDFFVQEFESSGFRGPLNWYRNIDRSWELSGAFQGKTIEQPSLFISGDRDLIRMNPGYEEAMRAVAVNLQDPVILPGIGHWTQQEAPEAVNEALLGFLSDLP